MSALRNTAQPLARIGEAAPAVRAPANMNQRQLALVSSTAVLEEGGPPRAGTLTAIAVLLMIVGAIAWSANTMVTNATMAPGSVTPSGAVIEVQHYEGGIVASVPVAEGDLVEEGQILMVLDPTADGADLQQMLARRAFLGIATERLRAEAAAREPDFDEFIHDWPDLVMNQIDILESGRASLEAEQAVLLSRVDQRITDIDMFRAQVDSLQQQKAVVGEQLAMRQTLLERGLASRLTVLDVQREYTRLDGELAQARTSLAGAEQAVEEARHSSVELELRYRSEAIQELGKIAAELAEVNETLIALEDRVARREVVSPARGIVNRLAARLPGQVVEPGQPIASIVPTDGGLIIEAQLPPADVGYVAIGQHAEITVDGFDMAQFGTVSGTVTYISPTTMTTEEGETYYRIRVVPDELSVGRGDNLHQLIPGMVVQASIHTGEQSMLAYLIRPVYRSLASAFAER
jgi:membrane fusion protein, adhesin transport system